MKEKRPDEIDKLLEAILPPEAVMFPKYKENGEPITIAELQDMFKMTEAEMKAICLETVKEDSIALMFMPDVLKTAECCLASVSKDGNMLEFVPEELKTADICSIAIKKNIEALQFAPVELQDKIKKEIDKI